MKNSLHMKNTTGISLKINQVEGFLAKTWRNTDWFVVVWFPDWHDMTSQVGQGTWLHLLSHHKINTSLLMLRERPYTASSRDSGCIGKYIPQGPRGTKFSPLGNLLVLGGCISQYIPPLGSVRIQYLTWIYRKNCTSDQILNWSWTQNWKTEI